VSAASEKAAAAACRMLPMARLYRKGNVKPGAITVNETEFHALCDIATAAPELVAIAERFIAGCTEGEQVGEIFFSVLLDDARRVLGRLS
jgi:hypothetical protein